MKKIEVKDGKAVKSAQLSDFAKETHGNCTEIDTMAFFNFFRKV